MSSPAGVSSVTAAVSTMRLLHLALLGSVGVYVVVLLVVTHGAPSSPPPGFSELALLFWALAGVAAAQLGAIGVLRRAMMPPRRSPQQLDDVVADEPLSAAAKAALAKLMTASMLGWALADAIGVYGLVLGFLLHALWPIAPFAVAAAVALVVQAPRRSVIEQVIRAADAAA